MERYSRQILFQPIGRPGQERLLASRVVVIGQGALGTVIADHLAPTWRAPAWDIWCWWIAISWS